MNRFEHNTHNITNRDFDVNPQMFPTKIAAPAAIETQLRSIADRSHRSSSCDQSKVCACVRDLLAFLGYLELCIHNFRCDLSAPETHEFGEYSTRVGSDGDTQSYDRKNAGLVRPNPS